MDSSLASLVSLSPSGLLVFCLERGTQPKTILRITNTSTNKIVFKVKTTQPTWYYVRPNQQMLDVGQSEDVVILLVDTECNRFLDQSLSNNEEKLEKHRFLVQSKIIEDNEYTRISDLAAQFRSDEFTKIWEGPKDDRKNIKLKVEFKYPGNVQTRPAVSDSVEIVRGRISRNETAVNVGSSIGAFVTPTNNPEMIFSELQNLRKKYDAVVEYTVHLTAERDTIVSQLETSQRELVKEKSKKKSSANSVDVENGLNRLSEKKSSDKGFSLIVVLFIALLFFIIGKYFF